MLHELGHETRRGNEGACLSAIITRESFAGTTDVSNTTSVVPANAGNS